MQNTLSLSAFKVRFLVQIIQYRTVFLNRRGNIKVRKTSKLQYRTTSVVFVGSINSIRSLFFPTRNKKIRSDLPLQMNFVPFQFIRLHTTNNTCNRCFATQQKRLKQFYLRFQKTSFVVVFIIFLVYVPTYYFL